MVFAIFFLKRLLFKKSWRRIMQYLDDRVIIPYGIYDIERNEGFINLVKMLVTVFRNGGNK